MAHQVDPVDVIVRARSWSMRLSSPAGAAAIAAALLLSYSNVLMRSGGQPLLAKRLTQDAYCAPEPAPPCTNTIGRRADESLCFAAAGAREREQHPARHRERDQPRSHPPHSHEQAKFDTHPVLLPIGLAARLLFFPLVSSPETFDGKPPSHVRWQLFALRCGRNRLRESFPL